MKNDPAWTTLLPLATAVATCAHALCIGRLPAWTLCIFALVCLAAFLRKIVFLVEGRCSSGAGGDETQMPPLCNSPGDLLDDEIVECTRLQREAAKEK